VVSRYKKRELQSRRNLYGGYLSLRLVIHRVSYNEVVVSQVKIYSPVIAPSNDIEEVEEEINDCIRIAFFFFFWESLIAFSLSRLWR